MEDSLFKAVYLIDIAKVMELLNDQNVDVTETDQLGRTPLQIACFIGFYEVCKKLLEKGARIDEDCFQRAQNGWDGFRQNEIIELLQEWKYSNGTPDC